MIALDQGTKSWALQSLALFPHRHHVIGPVYFYLTYNRGAAFSLGDGASPIIEVIAIALAVAVLWFSGRLAKGGANWPVIVGFGLLSGGALSNLADRFFRHDHGAVVDFIQLVSWWPVFNFADAAITIGAVTIAVSLVFSTSGRVAEPPQGRGAGDPVAGARADAPVPAGAAPHPAANGPNGLPTNGSAANGAAGPIGERRGDDRAPGSAPGR
ncbi:MAG: signal peptidase II [Acidimicrobiales bacterium]